MVAFSPERFLIFGLINGKSLHAKIPPFEKMGIFGHYKF
ncbi:hypothetical protein RU98_GL000653 [Enterococcus caccae]|nr:hypothetical protein RU98_GL000653 [Enterococcus caccae]